MLEGILEQFEDVDILKADGFDDAIIGIATDFTEPRLVYSVSKCLEILEEEFRKDEDCEDPAMDAIEHFTYNVSGGWVGELTPIWCHDNY